MKLFVFIVLASCVAFAAAVSHRVRALTLIKAIPQLRLTRDAFDDFLTIQNYLLNCPPALSNFADCLSESNYNPYPVTDAEVCLAARIEVKCLNVAIVPTSCPGQQEAIDAIRGVRVAITEFCMSIRSFAKLPLFKHHLE